MKFNTLPLILVCLMTLMATSPVLGLEDSNVRDNGYSNSSGDSPPSSTKQAQPPQWDAFTRTTALAGSGVNGYGGNLSMVETDVGFARRFEVNSRFELSSGLHYSLKNIDAPEDTRLPTSLHRFALNMSGAYRINDNFSLNLMVSPGLSGDFKVITSSDIRVPVAFHARYRVTPKLTIAGGLMYAIGNHELPLLPIIGAMYQLSEKWTLALAFPRTGIMLKPNKTTEYYIGAEFSGGEYRLHDASKGANIISYWDYRAIAGLKWKLSPIIELGVAGGYSFSRKFVFRESERDDVNVNDAPFGRVELKFMW